MSIKSQQKPERSVIVSNDRLLLVNNFDSSKVYIMEKANQVVLERAAPDYTIKYSSNQIPIYAIYGIIPLFKQKFQIVVTDADIKGCIADKHIWVARKFEFIPLVAANKVTSEDKKFIKMLDLWFSKECMLFSYSYDLTISVEKNLENDSHMQNSSDNYYYEKKNIFEDSLHKTNNRFFYNEHQVDAFIEKKLYDWVIPFVCGFFEARNQLSFGKHTQLALFSRRDKSRAGMRFLSRGADINGNVSNFAETEQIFTVITEDGNDIFSFMQIRGSIPFFWSMLPTIKYAPKTVLPMVEPRDKEAYQGHRNMLLKNYNNCMMVNLIDKKPKSGQQKQGMRFQQLNDQNPSENIGYTWFDFHGKTKGMKYENLGELQNEIKPKMDYYGHYHNKSYSSTSQGARINSKISSQNGVIRTNCVDNLDRTNVFQSVIARNVQLQQLHQANQSKEPSNKPFEELPSKQLEEQFRDIWTLHADVLSRLYSGTGALKTDFTKTGKRTKAGALEDGRRSMIRYFFNNYEDSYKQNALDLLLGKASAQYLVDYNTNVAENSWMRLLAQMFGPVILSTIVYQLYGRTQSWTFMLIMQVLCIVMALSYMNSLNKRSLENIYLKD